MSENNEVTPDRSSGVSRRTVTKAMAWAAPTIAVAATVPRAAASCIPAPVIDPTASCKKAGQEQSYKLIFTVGGEQCEAGDCTVYVTLVREATGQGRTIYAGPTVQSPTPVLICDTNNMASRVDVYARIVCGSTDYGFQWYDNVDMPNFNSTNNTCADSGFCTP